MGLPYIAYIDPSDTPPTDRQSYGMHDMAVPLFVSGYVGKSSRHSSSIQSWNGPEFFPPKGLDWSEEGRNPYCPSGFRNPVKGKSLCLTPMTP